MRAAFAYASTDCSARAHARVNAKRAALNFLSSKNATRSKSERSRRASRLSASIVDHELFTFKSADLLTAATFTFAPLARSPACERRLISCTRALARSRFNAPLAQACCAQAARVCSRIFLFYRLRAIFIHLFIGDNHSSADRLRSAETNRSDIRALRSTSDNAPFSLIVPSSRDPRQQTNDFISPNRRCEKITTFAPHNLRIVATL